MEGYTVRAHLNRFAHPRKQWSGESSEGAPIRRCCVSAEALFAHWPVAVTGFRVVLFLDSGDLRR